MRARLSNGNSYDYAVVRVVPRVEREEFVNVGVIVSCPQKEFLEARIEVDESRLKALDPGIDMDAIRAHLASIPAICTWAHRFCDPKKNVNEMVTAAPAISTTQTTGGTMPPRPRSSSRRSSLWALISHAASC